MARDLLGGKRILVINMMAQLITFNKAIKIGTLCVHVSAKQSAKEVKAIFMSCIENKSTHIIFKQETHSNIM